ncbi:MAG: AAA family ATPase [Ktedonobacteraceae bacterium]|nr:AAA family ATPase [Ktedonobacteraceae bacterium]
MKQELLDDIERMKDALQEAIADAQSAEETTYGGFDGRLLSKSGGNYTYQFTLRTYWDIDENAKIIIVDAVGEQERTLRVDGRVLSREAITLMAVTRTPVSAEHLAHVFFLEDKTWLLKRQLQALTRLQETSAEFGAKTLGLAPVQSGTKAVRDKLGNFTPHLHQERAIAHGLGSEKTIIVGPPGTGKTRALCDLICRYLRAGLSVLLLSHTNIATDNAFIRLIQVMDESKKVDLRVLLKEGLVVRAGDPRHVALRAGKHRRYTVNALAEARMGAQAKEREQLEKSLLNLDQQIEDLGRRVREQEKAWQPRRDALEEEIASLEEDMAPFLKRVQEREQNRQRLLTKNANDRKDAEEILAPLQKEERELTRVRDEWVKASERRARQWEKKTYEISQIRGMSRIRRFFSEYSDYDFEAADREVDGLLSEKEQADTKIIEYKALLRDNFNAQSPPRATIESIDRDMQVANNINKTLGNPDQIRINLIVKELEPLRQEAQIGEQRVSQAEDQVTQRVADRDRITAQIEDLKAQQESLKKQIVADAQLVATTITNVYLNLLEREFDVVVIDELSMISVIGVLLAASRAMLHFVGAGDPMQLSPVVKLVHEEKARRAKEWLGKDLFTYLKISIFDAIRGEKECCLLTEQGRSCPVIIEPINHFIYQNMLTSRPETAITPAIEPHPEWPLLLVDTTGTEAACSKPSKIRPRENEYHARLAVALARQALESLPPLSLDDDPSIPRVAIVAPYRSQAQLTQQKLREAKIAHLVHVGTINTVQSLEFPVVIFDTVEAPKLRPWEFTFDRTFDDRQMATEATRKLNVAWTRARHKLIVIAHRKHLHDHLPHHMQEDPARKQRLLVDLVDWAYDRGHMSAAEVLLPSPKK